MNVFELIYAVMWQIVLPVAGIAFFFKCALNTNKMGLAVTLISLGVLGIATTVAKWLSSVVIHAI